MYQVTITGKNFDLFKKAVVDVYNEMNEGRISGKVEKTIETVIETPKPLKEAMTNLAPVAPVVESPAPVVEAPAPVVESPAPVVEAPVAPVAPVAVGVELDTAGLPWDARIHTVKRTKVKTGTWKYKKGGDKALIPVIEAELRNSVALAANPAVIPPAPVAPVLTPAPVAPVVAPVVTPAPIPQPTMNTGGHTLETFTAHFIPLIAGLITEGKVSAAYIEELKAFFGVTDISTITDAQKAQMFENFVAGGIIQKV